MADWLETKTRELAEKTTIVVDRDVDLKTLLRRMGEYGGDYAYAIAEAVRASRDYTVAKLAYERWQRQKHMDVRRSFKTRTNKDVESIIYEQWPEEYEAAQNELREAQEKAEAASEFLRVWRNIKDIYIELARASRGEYQSSEGPALVDQHRNARRGKKA